MQYSSYSNDCSPINNGKSNTLLYLCDNTIADKPLPILTHKQTEDCCSRRNYFYDNNSSPRITPITSMNIRTCSADNEKSDSDASDRNISESNPQSNVNKSLKNGWHHNDEYEYQIFNTIHLFEQ